MNTVIINGKRYESKGGSVVVSDDQVIIDGKNVTKLNNKSDVIEIHGKENIMNITCDKSVTISGYIRGNVKAGGSVNCDEIGGNAEAKGSINCDSIGGKATAGGSINCDHIYDD